MPIAQLNGHDTYYEVHGTGEPALVMGGWGTFCHGGERHLPRPMLERFAVTILDYRGIGESSDDTRVPLSTQLLASDAAALADALGIRRMHVLGMVGIGACVAQELAIARPDLVRSLVMTGTWAKPDALFAAQLELFRDVYRAAGFLAFQKLAAVLSFEPAFYNANVGRILGPQGPWGELAGREETHARLVEACLTHDTSARLGAIVAPTLVVHAEGDIVTGPRLTEPIERAIPGAKGVRMKVAHIVAGREQKTALAKVLDDFYDSLKAEAV